LYPRQKNTVDNKKDSVRISTVGHNFISFSDTPALNIAAKEFSVLPD